MTNRKFQGKWEGLEVSTRTEEYIAACRLCPFESHLKKSTISWKGAHSQCLCRPRLQYHLSLGHFENSIFIARFQRKTSGAFPSAHEISSTSIFVQKAARMNEVVIQFPFVGTLNALWQQVSLFLHRAISCCPHLLCRHRKFTFLGLG